MEYRDYYETLGVKKDAPDKEIKKAYRRLARKYHPDVNPDDKQAEERFKEINEAYQVLSDSEKRKKYDQLGADWYRYQQQGGRPGDYDWSRWSSGGGPGFNVRYGSPEDLQDLFGGRGGGFSDFFNRIFGMGGARTAGRAGGFESLYGNSYGGQAGNPYGGQASPQRGQDYQQEVELSLYEAYHGATRVLEKDGRRLEIKIPPGAKTGTKVRLKGEGHPGLLGGQTGDLYLVVRVRADASWERKGDDVYTNVEVDLYTALLGGKVRVQTLSGPVMLTIQPGTQNGKTFRLRGKGMPVLRHKGEYGDLYAKVDVRLPTELTPQQRELVEQLQAAGTDGG
jgi:curved DNA-binding protein